MVKDYVGVILAAGKGERLFPLTANIPKPLLPFAGVEAINFAAYRLQRAGLNEFLVNVHHLGEQIITFSRANPCGFRIHISDERHQLLGTGGALGAMQSLRQGRGLVVISGDIITDFPVEAMLVAHRARQAPVTLALLPRPHGPEESKIWVGEGRVIAIGGEAPQQPGITGHGFANIHILDEEFLRLLPAAGAYGIMEVYRQAMARGLEIAAFVQEAFWCDIGLPTRYVDAHCALLTWWAKQPFTVAFDPLGVLALQRQWGRSMRFIPAADGGPSLVAADCHLSSDINLGSYVVVNPHAQIGAGVSLEEAVILEHGVVAPGRTIIRAIVGKDYEIPCGGRYLSQG